MKAKFAIPVLASVVLGACGGGNEEPSKLSLDLTDAPIDDAASVFVLIQGVSLNFEDGGWMDFDLDEVEKVDLLTLQSGNTLSLLNELETTPGEYKVRLNLYDDGDEATIEHSIVLEEGGTEHALFIPSGAQTGLKMRSSILVPESGTVTYTIDFDVRKSIVHRGQEDRYTLKPVLSLIENARAGSIEGVIEDTTLLTTDCSDEDPLTHNAIYVYEGHDVTPDDIGSAGAQPVTTVFVHFDEETGIYSYNVPFIEEGDYTISLTCNADIENIETDDELIFKMTSNETVAVVLAESSTEDNSEEEESEEEETVEDEMTEEEETEEEVVDDSASESV